MMSHQRAQFVFLAFVVGFVSDLVLRDLDQERLRPYFASRGVVEAAVIAGVLVGGVLWLTSLVIPHTDRVKYMFAVTVGAFLAAAIHDVTEPLGPELRAHSSLADSRLWDTLSGPFSAVVVYALQDYAIPLLCRGSTM